jgi:hypothetical protein
MKLQSTVKGVSLGSNKSSKNIPSIHNDSNRNEREENLQDEITSVLQSESINSKIDKQEQDMAVNHVSFFFGARACGALVFSLIGGIALEKFSKSTVFILSGCIPLMLFFYVWLVFEEKEVSQYSEEATAEEIRQIVEEHLKVIKPEYSIKEKEKKEKSIVFEDSEEIEKSKTFKFITKPSANAHFNKSKKKSEKTNESGFFANIKSKLGISNKSESLKPKSKSKTKYDFGNFESKKNSFSKETCYSVSDDFSMIYNKQRPNFIRDLKKILYVMHHPKIKRIILIVSLVMITPSFGSTWNYYLTNVIKLQPEDMGELNFMSSCGYLIGIIAMNTIFLGIKLKSFYRGTTIISSILLCTGLFLLFGWYKYLGINPKVFCAANSIVSNFFNEINVLPILALCCRFCPKKLEAMSYAVFMSITWITFITSQLFGVLILYYFNVTQDDFTNFWKCIIFQTVYGCIMAFIISIVYFPENFNDVSDFINSKLLFFLLISRG